MSNTVFASTRAASQGRQAEVNFNYIWDGDNWVPMASFSNLSIYNVISNASHNIHKFGSNPDVSNSVSKSAPEAIWDGSSQYTFPSDSGESIQVKSSNSGDNQEIVIQGLDENFQNKTWTGNLNGTNDVNVTGSWARIFRAYNNDSTNFAGTISIHKSGLATNYAQILGNNNQTLMSIYTVPSNCNGYLLQYNLSAQNPDSSSEISYTIAIMTREYGKTFRVQEISSVNTASSVNKEFPFPLNLKAKTDIIFNIIGASKAGGSVNGTFDIALI